MIGTAEVLLLYLALNLFTPWIWLEELLCLLLRFVLLTNLLLQPGVVDTVVGDVELLADDAGAGVEDGAGLGPLEGVGDLLDVLEVVAALLLLVVGRVAARELRAVRPALVVVADAGALGELVEEEGLVIQAALPRVVRGGHRVPEDVLAALLVSGANLLDFFAR